VRKISKNIKGITVEINGETGPLQKALGGVNKTSRDLQAELRNVERLLKLDPKNTELLAQKQKILAESITNTKEKLVTLKTAEEQAQQKFAEGKISEEQYRKLQQEVIKTEQELKKLEKAAEESNTTLKKIAETSDKIAEKSKKVSKAMTPVTVAVGGAAVAAGKMSIDFETSMAKVSTIADETVMPIDDLKDSILKLSSDTGIAATGIADNIYDAISAGQSTGEAVDFVTNSTKLAKAGFAEAGQSLDTLTTIMNSYGLESEEVNKVSDILVQTQNKGKVTVGELADTMGKVIPTANSMGVNLEQVATGYAIMTSKGIKAAETTTYMNSMFNEMGKSGTTASKAIEAATGKTFPELIESGQSVGDVLNTMNEYAEENGKSLTDMFGSAEAGKAALLLSEDQGGSFNEMLVSMGESAGATDAAFEKVSDTTGQELTESFNSLKNSAIQLGDILTPFIKDLSIYVKTLIDRFAGLSEGQKKTIVVVLALIAAIAPVAFIISGIATAVSFLAAGFALFTLPVIAVIAVIAAVIAIGVLLWKNWDTIMAKLKQFGSFISTKFNEIKESISNKVEEMKTAISTKIEDIKSSFINKFNEIKEKTIEIFNSLVEAITGFAEKVYTALGIDKIVSFVINSFNFLKDTVTIIFEMLVAIIGVIFSKISTILSPIIAKIVDFIVQRWTNLKNNTMNAFNAIKDVLKNIWNKISSAIKTVTDFIGNIISKAWDKVSNKTSSVFNSIKSVLSSVWDSVKTKTSSVVDSIFGKIKSVFDKIKGTMTKPIDDAKNTISKTLDTIKSFFTNLILKFPMPKMPRFSVSRGKGTFMGVEIPVPKFNVKWNADGALFKKPTIFNTPMGMQGFGEAGAEAALPLTDKVLGTIGQMIASTMDQKNTSGYNTQPIILQTILNGRVIAEEIHSDIGQLMGGRTNLNYAMKGV